jgi:hypothetical protein
MAKGDRGLEASQRCSEAMMNTITECQISKDRSVKAQFIGGLPNPGIAVGGAKDEKNSGAGRDLRAMKGDGHFRHSHQGLHR